jgi:hypothetical protein
MSYRIAQALLPLFLLSACGGGASPAAPASAPVPAPVTPPPATPAEPTAPATPANPTTPAAPTYAVSVASASGAAERRLPCNRSVLTAACGLRMYQVMVEAFVDGDPAANFNAGYGTSAHKGDLAGII